MKTYKKKLQKVVDEVYCDACGENCTIEEPCKEYEFATIEANWGYFSNQDGSYYNIDICENCFNETIKFLKNKRKQVLGPVKYPHKEDPLEGKSYFPS